MRSLYLSISRTHKKLLFIAIDLIALPLALWSSFALRFGETWPYMKMAPFWWMFIVLPLFGVFVFARLGLYRAVVRFIGQQVIVAIVKGTVFLSIFLYSSAYLTYAQGFPRSVPIIFALISILYVAGTRFLVRGYYNKYIKGGGGYEKLLIYGAGDAGAQLALSLSSSREFTPVAFVDDDASLHGQNIHGLRVYKPFDIGKLIQKYGVTRVVLALPATSKVKRKLILDRIKHYPVHVQTMPSLSDLVSGKASYENLQEVDLNDLLGRDVIPPDDSLLSRSITGKVVMVTGAGGSIGSELCRQIIKLSPRLLVMYEQSEFELYSIEKDILNSASVDNDNEYGVIAILGSVLNCTRLDNVVSQYKVNTIFHAAAYKHVPMVEHNVLEGVRNNIFGTKIVADAALRHGVERFILISTDKAVRPTNVMGATKRVAEQVVQALAEDSQYTIFSMVRFGNVLGSSGSVVPLFRKQIEQGGPITITHKDITRYFMSIPEAAQLVIQAGSMAQGGDVFVLDMGKPVKIYDLAKTMIELSGLQVLDEENPTGDIAINVTGLRPGEKLYEELLIGNNVSGTQHPLIMRANEEHLPENELYSALGKLEACINDNDPSNACEVLQQIVVDYRKPSKMVDYLQGDVNKKIVYLNS